MENASACLSRDGTSSNPDFDYEAGLSGRNNPFL